jgi:hypothetical protein
MSFKVNLLKNNFYGKLAAGSSLAYIYALPDIMLKNLHFCLFLFVCVFYVCGAKVDLLMVLVQSAIRRLLNSLSCMEDSTAGHVSVNGIY